MPTRVLAGKSALRLVALAAGLGLAGCDDGEVCLSATCDGPAADSGAGGAGGGVTPDVGPPGPGGAGGGGPGGAGGGAGGEGGSAEPPWSPDVEVFQTDVMAIMGAKCANPGCHNRGGVRPFQLNVPDVPGAALAAGPLQENLDAIEGWVDRRDPPQSPLLLFALGVNRDNGLGRTVHPPTLMAGTADYQTILAWLEDAVFVEPMGAGGEGGGGAGGAVGGLPCEGLPGSDPLGRDAYYAMFTDEVNPMLLMRCAEADCHGTPRVALGNIVSRYWLKDGECSDDWNFTASQLFIDPRQPETSPLLTRPLSRNHGGREVFRGQADPGYVLLRRWVLSGLQP